MVATGNECQDSGGRDRAPQGSWLARLAAIGKLWFQADSALTNTVESNGGRQSVTFSGLHMH